MNVGQIVSLSVICFFLGLWVGAWLIENREKMRKKFDEEVIRELQRALEIKERQLFEARR